MYAKRILKLKVNWCFEMFQTQDDSLTTLFLSSHPCMQRSEDCLDDIEAKIDVLVAWLMKLRVNKGTPHVMDDK